MIRLAEALDDAALVERRACGIAQGALCLGADELDGYERARGRETLGAPGVQWGFDVGCGGNRRFQNGAIRGILGWEGGVQALYQGLVDGSDVLGVIGLVCSTDEDRARVLGHKDVYVQFIERCAEFILHKLHDHADLLRARSFLDIMLRILEINSRGIVIFNAKGGISYLNDIARRDLGLKDDGLPTDVQFKRTGESFSDLEEFVVTARSRKYTLMGQMTPLAPSDYHFATVFTFESLPRMADRVSSLGDSLSGVENLIGRSPAMLQLKDQIRQIAGSTSTVLVTGESGTGKELVARAIHFSSPRSQEPFVSVNCMALNPGVLESELFGHEKGSFTGAVAMRRGRFEQASGGTLFLDEVGELTPELQVKLLRVLQERRFERVGGSEEIEVDIRIVAATNKDLMPLVQAGTFREDLYYRLNVVHIPIPPLRERREDIPLLVAHFAEKAAKENGIPPKTFSTEALNHLSGYEWPGNIRQLQNVVERCLVLVPGDVITLEDLPAEIRDEEAQFKSAVDLLPVQLDLADTLERIEAALIRRALVRADFVQAKAAELLGISKSLMQYKLKKYSITGH